MTAETKYAAALAIRENRFRELAVRIMYRNFHDHPAVARPAAEFNRTRREGKAGGLDYLGTRKRNLAELEVELRAALSQSLPEERGFLSQVASEFGLHLPESSVAETTDLPALDPDGLDESKTEDHPPNLNL